MKPFAPLTDDERAEAHVLFTEVIVPVMAQDHQDDPESPERNGAYLGIRDLDNTEVVRQKGGAAGEEAFADYSEKIDGKNDALEAHPDIETSWEVHKGDLTQKPYPGAIRTAHDDRIAISGFSWQRDTIGCLWLAVRLGRIGIAAAAKIADKVGIKKQFIALYRKLNAAAQANLAA